ncbi:cryptochrome/photolyase family protein [Rhizobium rhizogenes]
MTQPVIVWFRDDLRLADNPALDAAISTKRPIICVFNQDEVSSGLRPLGGAAGWWLHGALAELNASLASRGGSLLLTRGPACDVILDLATALNAQCVYWNRRYGEAERAIDAAVKASLRELQVDAKSFNGNLLNEPWTIKNASGEPFRMFTPFWRAVNKLGGPPVPIATPSGMTFASNPDRVSRFLVKLEELKLEPSSPDWAGGLRAAWRRGESAAQDELSRFLADQLSDYAESRDRPDKHVTSHLSPYLRFGNISVRQVWHAAIAAGAERQQMNLRNLDKFLSELGWREFSYNLLYHNPDLSTQNLQRKFDRMAWRRDPAALKAWQQGRTGYPLVDAGMRQLWATGWMHNRVRMIAASFLVKHLLIDWREGEAWFWDTLIDADPANNPASWQWVAGTGTDAAPYYRIFNPILQGERFDPNGVYAKEWIPALKDTDARYVHRPWEASGSNAPNEYCPRLILHEDARSRAMANFSALT